MPLTAEQREAIARAKDLANGAEQAFYDLGLEIQAMINAVHAAGGDPIEVAGADLMERIEVAWGLWARISRAIEALENGTASLVQYEAGKWGVVPNNILRDLAGRFLGGWQIWVGAVAAVVAVIGVWLLVDYYLEVRDAESKAKLLHRDLQRRYQGWLEDLCRRDPAACEKAIAAYEETFRAPPAEIPEGGAAGMAAAAGGAGLAIGVLLAMWALSRNR